jgi:serine/threonine-protein kinase
LALLDDAVGRDPSNREAWLAGLAATDPETHTLLLEILLAVDDAGADTFLEILRLLARQLASEVGTGASPGKQYGAYRLLRRLGHGGMGSVWLAERADGLFARQVALKLVHPSLMGSAAGERFARERAILAGLSHPHITRLLDAGFADDGQPYLALEYVDGTPLTQWCDQEHCSIRARTEVFQQVLSAVQYAHANLVVHRDLKPTNILVTPDGQVRLLDFGITKLLQEGKTQERTLTQMAGGALTLAYASPEQIAGQPITTASDVYSLGVVLHELLCGVRPYRPERESAGALEEAILSADQVRPSQSHITADIAAARATTARKLRQMLAGDLDTILGKALRKDPADRYATVEAFAQDLKRSLAGPPVLARPDSAWYRWGKWVARHRLAAVASALILGSFATGAGGHLGSRSGESGARHGRAGHGVHRLDDRVGALRESKQSNPGTSMRV